MKKKKLKKEIESMARMLAFSFEERRVLEREIERLKNVCNESFDTIGILQGGKSNIESLESEFAALKAVNNINEQALISCENANRDLHSTQRYLETIVSKLIIKNNKLHEEISTMLS